MLELQVLLPTLCITLSKYLRRPYLAGAVHGRQGQLALLPTLCITLSHINIVHTSPVPSMGARGSSPAPPPGDAESCECRRASSASLARSSAPSSPIWSWRRAARRTVSPSVSCGSCPEDTLW